MSKSFNADAFNLEEELNKVNKDINKPNILICGATGVGKSSFINEVFEKNIARVGDGAPITKGIKRYEDKQSNVVLYDSEGYEIGEEKQDYFKDEIIGIIDKYKKDYSQDLNKQIHQVWYFISAANKRVTETDIEVVNLIKQKNVPIAIVLTQIDNVDLDELVDMTTTIANDFNNIEYFTTCVTDDEEVKEAVKPYNQKLELIDWAIDNLEDSLKDGLVLSIHKNLETIRKHINKTIIPRYITLASGVGAVPIPVADAAVLAPLQLSMSVHIMKIYGIDKLKSSMTSIIQSSIISFAGKSLAGNILKLIPIVGTVVGSTINAAVAGSITAALGYAISELSFKYSQSIIEGKPIPINEIFNSTLIKETISRILKEGQ